MAWVNDDMVRGCSDQSLFDKSEGMLSRVDLTAYTAGGARPDASIPVFGFALFSC